MERWTEYCSELYKNEDDNDTVEELMKELEWILPPQKDDTEGRSRKGNNKNEEQQESRIR